MKIDTNKVMFLRGVLAMAASNQQLLNYDEVRRVCRLSDEQVGEYLDEARKGLGKGEPDFCAIVVKARNGKPGEGWGNLEKWAEEVQKTHQFWGDRRRMDNAQFQEHHERLPAIPGLNKEEVE